MRFNIFLADDPTTRRLDRESSWNERFASRGTTSGRTPGRSFVVPSWKRNRHARNVFDVWNGGLGKMESFDLLR